MDLYWNCYIHTRMEEAFRVWQLIRLPEELGGKRNEVSAFRMYSAVFLHLWCLWKYWPVLGCPRLDLEADKNDYLWILPPNWSPDGNGIVGFGRFLKT
jgi:rieske iron-sulfur protein